MEEQADPGNLLPYKEQGNFKLLGLTLDKQWAFHDHQRSALNKLRIRMAVLRKVSNSTWGLENRTLTTTVHALVESIIGYELTLTGSSLTVEDMEKLDTSILNPIARRATGVGFSIRRVVLYSQQI